MSTEQMVIELKSVTYELISLLERETQGVRELEPEEYELFVSEKSALSMKYEQIVVKLRARGEELRQLPDEEKAELRDLQDEFQTAARRNMIALQAAKATNERMVNAIVRAVKDHAKTGDTTYNRAGMTARASLGGYGRGVGKNGTSYSVNETL